MDQHLERILADDYLADLESQPVGDLRRWRAECESVENQLSYLRRMVQGRHDIVTAEIERRRGGGSSEDGSGLVDRLPEILADRMHAPSSGRPPTTLEVEELSGSLVERLDALEGSCSLDAPQELGDSVLQKAVVDLGALEEEVSGLRRRLFDRIDTIQAELTRRYRTGEVRVDDLLHDES